jgi:hypothetical protein
MGNQNDKANKLTDLIVIPMLLSIELVADGFLDALDIFVLEFLLTTVKH